MDPGSIPRENLENNQIQNDKNDAFDKNGPCGLYFNLFLMSINVGTNRILNQPNEANKTYFSLQHVKDLHFKGFLQGKNVKLFTALSDPRDGSSPHLRHSSHDRSCTCLRLRLAAIHGHKHFVVARFLLLSHERDVAHILLGHDL